MSNEIVLAESGNRDIIRSFDDVERAGRAMAASGYFNDAKDAAQCIVKILAGREMGFGPFAAMTGIHIIQGKPAPGANLMAAAIKRHPRYDYQVHKMEDKAVEIEFFQDGQTAGTSSFTAADAQRAGTKNMGKFPRNMLFARAISNGVKWFCPDVFNGATAYVPEELGVSTPVKSLPAAAIVEGEFVEPKSAAADADIPADLWDDAPEIPPQDAAPETETEPQPHWIEDTQTRKKFWAWTGEQGLSKSDVHAALQVKSVKDFTGDKVAAMEAISNWVVAQMTPPEGMENE